MIDDSLSYVYDLLLYWPVINMVVIMQNNVNANTNDIKEKESKEVKKNKVSTEKQDQVERDKIAEYVSALRRGMQRVGDDVSAALAYAIGSIIDNEISCSHGIINYKMRQVDIAIYDTLVTHCKLASFDKDTRANYIDSLIRYCCDLYVRGDYKYDFDDVKKRIEQLLADPQKAKESMDEKVRVNADTRIAPDNKTINEREAEIKSTKARISQSPTLAGRLRWN